MKRNECVPDCSGYDAPGVYDRTAGQRDPDVKACVHIPSCAAGFGPGEECSYAACVLGISEDIYKIDKDGNVVVNRLKDIDDALANIRVAEIPLPKLIQNRAA